MNDTVDVQHETSSQAAPRDRRRRPKWEVPSLLFVLTVASTTYANGWAYSLPLMAILLCHEFGHYIAARIHRVPASLPYFIPMPLLLGTMGAVIVMPERIRNKNALFDIGAAGPLSGMAIAIPVLIYGIAESPIAPQSTGPHLMEGYSLLYLGLVYLIKGPIPEGQDIHLTPTAFAGWVGLLVTMINLLPAAQLDGGHIAHALFGERQERVSRLVRRLLLPLAVAVALYHGLAPWMQGRSNTAVVNAMSPGMSWLVWGGLLALMVRATGREHPPTEGTSLSPRRRTIALLTLLLFGLIFMPTWLRVVDPTV